MRTSPTEKHVLSKQNTPKILLRSLMAVKVNVANNAMTYLTSAMNWRRNMSAKEKTTHHSTALRTSEQGSEHFQVNCESRKVSR